ncbi:MAG TPA: hypothetical protein ENN05_00455 [Deltaproteobacteria bacterium]|nr:hypothetical protein [Deltaproteobacteria bacterium]HHO74886.1 hypothetical protein [Deltaproteobacteria bacterium]
MHNPDIRIDMTVLDVVSEHEGTDKIFSSYDKKAGECICCNSLFETIEAVARKYKIDLESLIHDLEEEIGRKK